MTTKKTATAAKAPAAKFTTNKTAVSVAKPAVKAAAPQAVKRPKKEHKLKVVRDSFTMPEGEYQKIAEIKALCLKAGMPVKKSEVLRAGLKALAVLNAAQLKRALGGLEKIKTGRPKKR
jgi:hypothetical protein